VTLTFFAFDWFLSLDATWYSTIFGVWFFAQSRPLQDGVAHPDDADAAKERPPRQRR
jgi:hypothetical protein